MDGAERAMDARGPALSQTLSPKTRLGRTSSPGSALYVGGRFGPGQRYELEQPIGAGGSAVVHRVRDRKGGALLAGKFPLASREPFVDCTLARESELLSRLRHESIVSFVDCGTVDEIPYLIMEFLEGDTLGASGGGHAMSTPRATLILIDVVSALVHAHGRGILHLDLKPSNVLLLETGRAKLIDFGAGDMSRAPVGEGTAMKHPSLDEEPLSGAFLKGTLHYMAPEQWALKASDPRMDIWGAGMLYYELLTGQLPFGAQPTCLRLRGAQLERVPFSAASLGLPLAVETIMARTLAHYPQERFASASELLAALRAVLAGGSDCEGDAVTVPSLNAE